MVYIGNYEILSHAETPECSVRLIKVTSERHVQKHYHQDSAQVYVALDGEAVVVVDEDTRILRPYQSIGIPRNACHGVTSHSTALVLSISIPPLRHNDQQQAA
ncbi:MAG: cupin domain-containing protein [Chloroflexi bacterium]|nr:cupin domain-containing protein [Chloroflexota bacterium]